MHYLLDKNLIAELLHNSERLKIMIETAVRDSHTFYNAHGESRKIDRSDS